MKTDITRKSLSKSQYMKIVVGYYKGQDDWKYKAIDAYVKVDNAQQWNLCPKCGLFPKVWNFNNGSSTACGCGESQYRHFSIHAESIMSFVRRSHNGKSAVVFDNDSLRKNWNHWCETGWEIFAHAGKRTDGLW